MNTHNRTRIPGAIDPDALGAYIPTNYANCELWLAADQIVANDGDAVSTWSDLSGNGRNFIQLTAARQPSYKVNIINGLPVVRFVDDWLQNTGMNIHSDSTFIMVVKPTTTTPQGIFDTGPNLSSVFRNYSSGSIEWHSGAPSFSLGLANTNPVLIMLIPETIPSRRVYYYKNGSLISTNTNSSTAILVWQNPAIGAINLNTGLVYAGDIAEFIVYSRALTATEIKNSSDYLLKKYGIV